MTPRLPALVAAVAAALLAACAGEEQRPASAMPRAATRATPAAAAAPVTRFDGYYTGPLALLPDRTRRCLEAPNIEREITVRNGRASLMYNPQVQQVLTGTVGEDGSVRMADSLDRTIATSGVFDADGFVGEHRSGLCTYSVRMTKRNR
jgi:outer membrane lipoprotein-sorting protein